MTRRRLRQLAYSSTVLAIGVVGLAFALPGTAHAYIYWSYGNGIARANPDGSMVNRRFMPMPGLGFGALATTDRYIYIGGHKGAVLRARLDGRDAKVIFRIPQFLTQPSTFEEDASFLAMDKKHIYWSAPPGEIGRANIDGSHVQPDFINPSAGSGALALDAHYLYWPHMHSIARARVDGSSVEPNFIPLGVSPYTIALADGHIFWTTFKGHAIGRANLDGREANESYIPIPGFASEITVGGRYLYWVEDEDVTIIKRKWISRANLDGRDLKTRLVLVGVNGNSGAVLAADGLGPAPKRTKR